MVGLFLYVFVLQNLSRKGKFENGTLKMLVPKKEEQKAVENKKYIAIEG